MSRSHHPITVLVADDHAIVREGLISAFALADGLRVVGEAMDADEAVNMSSSLQPDIVLLDLHMPNGGGVTATERILSDRPEARVVILTSYDAARDISSALNAGAMGYLLKSSSSDDIVRAIHVVAQGGAALDPKVAATLLQGISRGGDQIPQITNRQLEILQLISEGLGNLQIGEQLHLSVPTIKSHITEIFRQLGVSDRTEAVVVAMRLGILQLER